ncbi:ExeA family protein [Deferrisoma sp.]
MYETYWNLHAPPFENVPDPRFFYASEVHRECLARVQYAVSRRKGAVLVVGDVGCGKTLLCRRYLATLSPGAYDVALLVHPSLDPVGFLREVLRQWGEAPRGDSKDELLGQVRARLLQNHRRGVESLLVVDEAQAIQGLETLEELRLLLNHQLDDRFLLTVVLLGQPEVLNRIRALPQLHQRIGIRARLGPLTQDETVRYVLTRLKRAGATRCMFRPRALAAVYRLSRGVPRDINTLCDLALLRAYLERAPFVEEAHVAFADEEVVSCA